jgi:hypothetical protein
MVPEIFALALVVTGGGPAALTGWPLAAAQSAASGIDAASGESDAQRKAPASAVPPAFLPADRSVSNWRAEAAVHLTSPGQSALLDGASNVPRCVKLNNYWCVKRAGWAGEIAADSERHVAFASAAEGAIVAAMLLRRYYLVYRLHSAQQILSRWAPAQCGPALFTANRSAAARTLAMTARLTGIATRGIGNTLRARWLASHRPGFAGRQPPDMVKPSNKRFAPYRSLAPTRTVSLMRAPEIAVGMGEQALDHAPMKVDLFDPPLRLPKVTGQSCVSEDQRIRNYAIRATAGLAAGPDEDLFLFSPEGAPGPNLALLMRNMAGVEIGPLSVRKEIIEQAVAREAERTAALQAATPPLR